MLRRKCWSPLVQVMSWSPTLPSHYINQYRCITFADGEYYVLVADGLLFSWSLINGRLLSPGIDRNWYQEQLFNLRGVWRIPHVLPLHTGKGIFMFPTRPVAWWRHQMETFSALLSRCTGNSPVPREFPSHRPATWHFDVFLDLRLNKRFSKQSRCWWFERLSDPLWRHCNGEYRRE